MSYLKCCESLSFLVRDVVHITPENFSNCVAAIRTFVEASYKYVLPTICVYSSLYCVGVRAR